MNGDIQSIKGSKQVLKETNMNILGLEISEEVKQEEMRLNERISKLTEQQLLAFRQTHLRATEKISAWIEIDHEWRLINGGEEIFRKEEGKRTLIYLISFLATALILNFLSISSTEKAVAFGCISVCCSMDRCFENTGYEC